MACDGLASGLGLEAYSAVDEGLEVVADLEGTLHRVKVQSLLIDRRVLIVLDGEMREPGASAKTLAASLEATGATPLRHEFIYTMSA